MNKFIYFTIFILMPFSVFSSNPDKEYKKLIEKYDGDLKAYDYSNFAPDLLRYCGSIVMKRIEEDFGTFISYYRIA